MAIFRHDRMRQLRKNTVDPKTNERYTQETFAEAMGVSKKQVGEWERGQVIPSTVQVVKMALIFVVTTDHLLDLSDDPRGYRFSAPEHTKLSDLQRRIVDAMNRGDLGEVSRLTAQFISEQLSEQGYIPGSNPPQRK